MPSWQRLTAITTGVLALHGAALWAVQAYKAHWDIAVKIPALSTRMLEPPKPPEVKLPEPLPLPIPLQPAPKPAKATPPPTIEPRPNRAPLPNVAPTTTPAEQLPLAATNPNPNPGPHAPTGSAAPAVPPMAAPVAPAPTPALQLPSADVEHADNQYRASYPKMSQRLGQEGRVLLRVTVAADGKPTAATVAKSSGFEALDRAGIDTVMHWRFKPGTRGGVPEAMSVLQPVDFKLPS
jgi:periplasmic protein TonB